MGYNYERSFLDATLSLPLAKLANEVFVYYVLKTCLVSLFDLTLGFLVRDDRWVSQLILNQVSGLASQVLRLKL